MTAAQTQWAKRVVYLVALAPMIRIGVQAAQGTLGANPIAEALNRLGFWALVLLLATLALTPLKLITRSPLPAQLRRLLGLMAFTYAAFHLITYAAIDQGFDLALLGEDLIKRKFIAIGMLALAAMVPLAVTSTNGMIRRLGGARWRQLHRLVYLAAAAGVIHFVFRVKKDLREPLIFAAVLAALMGVRLWSWLRSPVRKAAPAGVNMPPAGTGEPPPS